MGNPEITVYNESLFQCKPHGNCGNWTTPYGTEYEHVFGLAPIYLIINGTTQIFNLGGFAYTWYSNVTLNYPMPGYTVVIWGDTPGYGPILMYPKVINLSGNLVTLETTTNITLAINRTYYGYAMLQMPAWSPPIPSQTYIVPCRLDIIYAPNPQLALNITVPFGQYVAAADNYVAYSILSPEPFPYRETFGWWVWDYEAEPMNISVG